MTVKVENAAAFQASIDRLEQRVGRAMAGALVAGGQAVRAEAIKSIQSPSAGRQVTRSRVGGGTYDHVAAAKGQPPNTDTGALVKSIAVEPQGRDVFVGTSVEYGRFLEDANHPWLAPALRDRTDQIRKLVAKAVRSKVK